MLIWVEAAGTLLAAIASATTQPINVQPRKRLMTMIDPTLGTLRIAATMVGMK
jgi:hypothetical protein